MQCPNCQHQMSSTDGRCIYCGNVLDGHTATTPVPGAIFEKPPPVHQKTPDTSETLFDDMFQMARAERRAAKKKSKKQPPPVEKKIPGRVLSIDEIYNMLVGIRDTFENGFSEYPAYRRMSVDILKEHLMSLTNDARVGYMVHEIRRTKLAEFIDDDMFSLLVYYAVSTVVKKPDIKWKRRRKSFFFS